MKSFKYIVSIILILVCFQNTNAQITGKISVPAGKEKYKANTIVYIEKVNGKFNPPAKNAVMNQKALVFIPHVLPVIAGSNVDFLNSDDVQHNVFSPDKCCKFDLGSYGKGVSKSRKFDVAGSQAVILCNVHPEMEAYVVVLQNPYYFLTEKDGVFKINNVPPGTYKLKVWNEKLKAKDLSITVPASGKLEINIDLTK